MSLLASKKEARITRASYIRQSNFRRLSREDLVSGVGKFSN